MIPYYACSVYIIDTSGPIAHLILYSSIQVDLWGAFPLNQRSSFMGAKGIGQRLFQHTCGTYHHTLNQHLMKELHSFWRFWGDLLPGYVWGDLPRQIWIMNFRNRSIQARGSWISTRNIVLGRLPVTVTHPGPNWAAPSAFMLRGKCFRTRCSRGFMKGNPFIFGFSGPVFLRTISCLVFFLEFAYYRINDDFSQDRFLFHPALKMVLASVRGKNSTKLQGGNFTNSHRKNRPGPKIGKDHLPNMMFQFDLCWISGGGVERVSPHQIRRFCMNFVKQPNRFVIPELPRYRF